MLKTNFIVLVSSEAFSLMSSENAQFYLDAMLMASKHLKQNPIGVFTERKTFGNHECLGLWLCDFDVWVVYTIRNETISILDVIEK